jgi:poly-beta-1,6-N-acetyl-D-glucosamine N-deacetylase
VPVTSSFLKRAVFAAFRATLVPFLFRELLQRRSVTFITYHAPTPEVFDAHLAVLKRLYHIVALSDYVAARERGASSRLPSKALVITLDDGHRSNHALKAVIRTHQVPVTIFLCSGIVGTSRRFWFQHPAGMAAVQRLKGVDDTERLRTMKDYGFEETREFDDRQALSDSEIDDLRDCVDFQSHTVFHPILPRCQDDRAWFEIEKSRHELHRRLATDIYAFAYPNGSYSDRDVEFVKAAGYRCALTLDRGRNSDTTSLFRLHRVCVPDEAGRHELLVKVSGVWGAIAPALRWSRFGRLRRVRPVDVRSEWTDSVSPR